MLAYADRPLRVDTRHTRQKLDWSPKDEYRVLNRVALLMGKLPKSRQGLAGPYHPSERRPLPV